MTAANNTPVKVKAIQLQPSQIATYLPPNQNYYLFLDIDGTLAKFTLDPKQSFIPKATLTLLQKIQQQGVMIAAVTGRSLIEAKKMLSFLQLPIAATHGLEIAIDNSGNSNLTSISIDIAELIAIKNSISQYCLPYPELRIENKPYSVALHFREHPILADTAFGIMEDLVKNHPNWELKSGKYVWELVPKGVNKGGAILALLDTLPACDNICPIFIGDDVTDELGFLAVQGEELTENGTIIKRSDAINGLGIKVGDDPTFARYHLRDIAVVTSFLESFLSFCQRHINPPNNLITSTSDFTNKTRRHAI